MILLALGRAEGARLPPLLVGASVRVGVPVDLLGDRGGGAMTGSRSTFACTGGAGDGAGCGVGDGGNAEVEATG